MWKSVDVVLLGLVAAGSCALNYGPCHTVTTVDMDTTKWPGIGYINVMTYNLGARCLWTDKGLKYADGNSSNLAKENVMITEVFHRIENGTLVNNTNEGKYVDKGHYRFTKELTPGNTYEFEAYWLYFALPGLDIHFVCSNAESLKNGKGAFWVESAYPDALEKNACEIKKIATQNKIDISGLMIADNCNCSNIPFAYTSSCKTVTIEDYFKGC